MNCKKNIFRSKSKGFTLSEIIIASSIAAVAIAGISTLMITGLKYYHYNGDKLKADHDLRHLTDEIAKNGTNASYYILYTSFTDRTVITSNSGVGDMAAFVYMDPTDTTETKVTKVITYYQDPTADAKTGALPVRKYTWTGTAATFNASSMLPNSSTPDSYQEIVQNVSDPTSGQTQLFCNSLSGRALIVKANVLYNGVLRPSVSNTYNFCVAPRG